MEYKHILLAVELDADCDDAPMRKALKLQEEHKAQLTLVHAIEHMGSYGAAYAVSAGADIEGMLLENSQKAMQELGDQCSVPASNQVVKVGPAGVVILDEAERLNADLVIVGSHGRNGIRLLLGSTANAVLHGAKCDVLAVRLQED